MLKMPKVQGIYINSAFKEATCSPCPVQDSFSGQLQPRYVIGMG